MSGELYLLTPITSPMVTRAASPDPAAEGAPSPPSGLGCMGEQGVMGWWGSRNGQAAAEVASPDRNNMLDIHPRSTVVAGPMKRPAPLTVATGSIAGAADSISSSSVLQQLGTSVVHSAPHPWTLLSCEIGAAIDRVSSATNSPKARQAEPASGASSNTSTPRGLAVLLPEHQQQCRWKSPACCASCGAAKADGGSCSGCSNMFCKACAAPAAEGAGKPGLGGPCKHCHSLCNACKPIACSFCDERGEDAVHSSLKTSSSVNRMCEACAGTCDSCKRAACAACAGGFASCSNCGYASCEECRLQAHMSAGTAAGSAGVTGGCWCAPPLRMASNVRYVSSQRYQMSQLHPSVLACSMEAVGLRDADFDDYDDYDVECDTYNNQEQYDDMQHDGDWMPTEAAGVSHGTQHQRAGAEGSSVATQIKSRALESILEDLGCSVSPASSCSSSQAVYGSYGSYGITSAAAHGGACCWKRQQAIKLAAVHVKNA